MPPHLFTSLCAAFDFSSCSQITYVCACACILSADTSLALLPCPALPCPTTGVPLKRMVAGVAMGLILEPDGRFVVLTDILGSGEWGSVSPRSGAAAVEPSSGAAWARCGAAAACWARVSA